MSPYSHASPQRSLKTELVSGYPSFIRHEKTSLLTGIPTEVCDRRGRGSEEEFGAAPRGTGMDTGQAKPRSMYHGARVC